MRTIGADKCAKSVNFVVLRYIDIPATFGDKVPIRSGEDTEYSIQRPDSAANLSKLAHRVQKTLSGFQFVPE